MSIRLPQVLTLEAVQAAFRDVEKKLAPSAMFDMRSARVCRVANGVAPGDAVNLAQLEERLRQLRKESAELAEEIRKLTPASSNPVTTKGDLAGFASAPSRVPVGSNGSVLTADSAEALGLKWGSGPLTTKGDLAGFTTALARVPVGSNGLILTSDSAEGAGVKWGNGPLTTKGDLLGFGTAGARVAVGSNNQHLVPDSAQATGLKWLTPSACRLVTNANQAIGTASDTAIAFAAETFDNSSMHDNATNNSRVTAAVAGKYVMTATSLFAANATGTRIISFFKNGSFYSRGQQTGDPGNLSVSLVHADTILLAANDYVEVKVYQSSGGNLNIISGYSSFSVVWIGD